MPAMTEPSAFTVPPTIAREPAAPTADVPAGAPVRKILVVVDGSPEVRIATLYACRRAASTEARVSLLAVVEPVGFQPSAAVQARMLDEAFAEAQARVYAMAEIVVQATGRLAEFVVREGNAFDEITRLVDEEPEIRLLVLAAASGSDGPGPLVSRMVSVGGGFVRPVTIVPPDLTDEEIDLLA